MDGCLVEVDQEFASDLTLVLLGNTGSGESATGNCILGNAKTLEDGRIFNVIDIPGMFDSSADPEFIKKQILCCIDMGKDGFHAILVVFSILNRFSEEENAVICSLVALFGRKIYDYIIIVFTGGDDFEESEKTLQDFLLDCPEKLKEVLGYCGNRCVIFDNTAKDEWVKTNQVQQLLSYVSMVLDKSNGEPYTNEIFADLKKESMELVEQTTEGFEALQVTEEYAEPEMLLEKMLDKHLQRITELFDSKFMEIQMMLEKLMLEGEKPVARGNVAKKGVQRPVARLKMEKKADEAPEKLEEAIVVTGMEMTSLGNACQENEEGRVKRSTRERKLPAIMKDYEVQMPVKR